MSLFYATTAFSTFIPFLLRWCSVLINRAPYSESGSISNPLRIRFSDFRSSREVRPCESHSVFGKTDPCSSKLNYAYLHSTPRPWRGRWRSFRRSESLQLVSHTPQEPLWDQLVRQYPLPGLPQASGARVQVHSLQRWPPRGCLVLERGGVREPGARDEYIGWSVSSAKSICIGSSTIAAFSFCPGCASRIWPPMCWP